jgi:hypothetical protein
MAIFRPPSQRSQRHIIWMQPNSRGYKECGQGRVLRTCCDIGELLPVSFGGVNRGVIVSTSPGGADCMKEERAVVLEAIFQIDCTLDR